MHKHTCSWVLPGCNGADGTERSSRQNECKTGKNKELVSLQQWFTKEGETGGRGRGEAETHRSCANTAGTTPTSASPLRPSQCGVWRRLTGCLVIPCWATVHLSRRRETAMTQALANSTDGAGPRGQDAGLSGGLRPPHTHRGTLFRQTTAPLQDGRPWSHCYASVDKCPHCPPLKCCPSEGAPPAQPQ